MARTRPMVTMFEKNLVCSLINCETIDMLTGFVRQTLSEGRDYSLESRANHQVINKVAKDLLLWQQLSDEEQQDIIDLMRQRVTRSILTAFTSVMTDSAILRLI